MARKRKAEGTYLLHSPQKTIAIYRFPDIPWPFPAVDVSQDRLQHPRSRVPLSSIVIFFLIINDNSNRTISMSVSMSMSMSITKKNHERGASRQSRASLTLDPRATDLQSHYRILPPLVLDTHPVLEL
eukprot:605034-Rhodomonas_salina.6